MPDPRRIIDEIRFSLQTEVYEATPELKELASDFAAECREVNSRLRRCGEFLKQDLRSEALQFADAEPKLLDLVAILDFPERANWDALVKLCDLPRPEPLLLDVAEELNGAYAAVQPLERLLERHRLLALRRAPLRQRLEVMKKIDNLDAGSVVWDADIRELEKARVRQIEEQATCAAEAGDAAALELLRNELQAASWREPPARRVIEETERIANETTKRSLLAGMADVEIRLAAALEARDVAQCRNLKRQWHALSGSRVFINGEKRSAKSIPALAWLAKVDAREAAERDFRTAVHTLESELDDKYADLEDIRQARYRVEKCDREMPGALAERAAARIRDLEEERRRQYRLRLIAAAVSFFLVIGIIGLLVVCNL